MSYDFYFWRRRPGSTASHGRIFARIAEDLEVDDLAPLDTSRIGDALDMAFPGWRGDQTTDQAAFIGTLDERFLVVETWGSTPASALAWLEDLAQRENLVCFDPQTDEVPQQDLDDAKQEATRIRADQETMVSASGIEGLRLRAERGDPNAQYELGNRYSFGDGIEPNAEAAFHWYRTAAENGSGDGMFNTAACYARGEGTSRDVTAAIMWYERAARSDEMLAPFALGEIYLTGDGVPRDNDRARHYFELAAEGGHPDARAALRMIEEPNVTLAMKKKAWRFWYA